MVQGTITVEKISNSTLDSYSGYDYGGDGSLWRSKVIFTPTKRLSPNTTYNVYISGDEDDSDELTTGIKTRSVFDTVKGSNVGTGEATFSGTYSGSASEDTLVVTIYTAGTVGTARFTWYRESAPLLVFGPFKVTYGLIPIVDDVNISFEDGSYEVGDTFSAVVKTGSIFTGNVVYPFTTGTGSIQTLPTSTSTTITGTPTSSTSTTSTLFTVSSTSPSNRETNLGTLIDQDFDIVIAFSDTLDATTVVDGSILVQSEPVNGDEDTITFSGILPKTLSVSGSEVTITVGSGYVLQNNVVTVTVDDSVSSSSGTSLSEDYEFYFTSTYSPLYSSVRKLKLEYGAYIGEIPDDTINLAIFEGSLTADNLTWNTTTTTGDYYQWVRREFTTCKAAETLLTNVIGQSRGLKSKALGDFKVEYDTAILNNGIDKALGCLEKWLATLQSRGAAVQTASMVIKGAWDPDRPPVGRGWTPPNRGMPIAKAKSRSTTSRRWTNGYYSPSKGRSGKGNTH